MLKDIVWTKKEKGITRKAFNKAYEKECTELIKKVKEFAGTVKNADDIWDFHDFLTKKRKELEKKYDYRASVLILVFGRLLQEGWIGLDDLKGLDEDKITKIKHFLEL